MFFLNQLRPYSNSSQVVALIDSIESTTGFRNQAQVKRKFFNCDGLQPSPMMPRDTQNKMQAQYFYKRRVSVLLGQSVNQLFIS